MSPPSFLQARDLVKVYGDRRVLDGVSVTASPGQRIGLIGENGVGKSTLLRLLAGVEGADSGEVTRPADIGFGHQELPYPGAATVRTVLDDALDDVRRALHRLDELGVVLAAHPSDPAALADYGDVLEWAQQHAAWDADRRAALALLVADTPDVLLLDEPTNHLSLALVEELEEALRVAPGAVVAASHDRWLRRRWDGPELRLQSAS